MGTARGARQEAVGGAGRRTRRTILAGLATAAGAGALAACGPAGAPAGGAEGARSGAEATGSVSWMYSDNPQASGFDRVAAAFKQEHPRVNLEVLHTPSAIYDKILAMFTAGTPPDVFRLNDDFVLSWRTKGVLAPLDQHMKATGIKKEDYHDAVINFPVQDGRTWAWFVGADPRLIVYNVDLFKRAGVPLPPTRWQQTGWTFDDFVDAARRLTRLNEQPAVYGACVYDDGGNEQTFSINNGSPTGIYSKDGRKFTLADPPGHEAIQWIADLTHKHRVQPTRQVRNEAGGSDDMFINSTLAMRFTQMEAIYDLQRQAPQLTWDVAPVPMRAKRLTESSVQTYALAQGAQNPDNGWRLLRFFTEHQAPAQAFIETGYVIPAKKQFAKDYIAAHKGKSPANAALIVEAFSHYTVGNQTLDTPAARAHYWGDAMLNKIWDGQVTASAGLTSVRGAVEAAIAPK
jgi:ABC-type glycerol-3-phosphate transport system substrate-binding protein